MEDVRAPHPLDLHVPDRRAPGQLVRAEEGGVAHPRGRADEVADEVVEGPRRHPLRDQGEQDVAAVAVGEALARRELLRVPVEDVEICLRRRELLHRDGEQVFRQVQVELLVEVVADPRPVREQVFDGDALVDEREISAEDRTRRPREAESSFFDETHGHERGQHLRAACDAELRVGLVRNRMRAVGEPVRADDLDAVAPVDTDDAGEPCLGCDPAEVARECAHGGARRGRCSGLRGDRPSAGRPR